MSVTRSSTEASKTDKALHNGAKPSIARTEAAPSPSPMSQEQCEVLYSALQDVCSLITQGVMANTAVLSLHYADTVAGVNQSDSATATASTSLTKKHITASDINSSSTSASMTTGSRGSSCRA